jgi:hypothetical protein
MKENIKEKVKVTERVKEINAACTTVRLNIEGNEVRVNTDTRTTIM